MDVRNVICRLNGPCEMDREWLRPQKINRFANWTEIVEYKKL